MTQQKPKPRPRASSVAAAKAMENRAARRLNRADVVARTQELGEQKKFSPVHERVLELMTAHNVPLRQESKHSLVFAKPQAASGVAMGLDLLVSDPEAMKVDLTVPWCGQSLSENAVKRMLNSLQVPKWARRLKDGVVNSISRPNVMGMLTPTGEPNKDLRQLLNVFRGKHELPSTVETARIKAVREIADDLISFLTDIEDELFTIVTNSRGEKRIRLKMWTLEQFQHQMAKAMKSSSPGYPYNGCSWQEEIEGYTCIEHAWLACQSLVSDDAVLPGFIFIQQSRATGDGGSGDEANSGGRQRLVMAAPNNEKLLGHILAYVFKLYARKSLFSGQRGIQEVSRNIKRECQRIISDENLVTADYWTCDYDVSEWDAAQLHEVMESDFFSVAELVLDDEDEFTTRVKTNYRIMYNEAVLVTAFGEIETEFLPSGSSITTASAFVNHEIKARVVDDLVTQERGFPLFHLYGFQGDDNASIVYKPTDRTMEILKWVYSSYHCRIKGDVYMSSLEDFDANIIFLNEAIRVRDPIDLDLNAKYPRWSLFWAENYRDKARGPNLDRMLYEEVLKSVPHPTATELTFVSFASKMDRFINMPFYTALLKWIRPRGLYAFRSWLGERVCPNSPTLLALKKLEESEGIFWPDPQARALDRREEFWADKDELAEMFVSLALLVPVSPEARKATNTILAKAKNTNAWKKARSAMEKAGVDFSTENGKLPIDEGRELISLAFQLGYGSTPSEIKEVVTAVADPDDDVVMEIANAVKPDKVPSERTVMRSLLALNEEDPYSLRALFAEAIIGSHGTPGWRSLPLDRIESIERMFKDIYGQSPDGEPEIDWLGN